ncbi:uncharacterized protein LOC132643831 [Lycium barbarum]|uniref:uncharacterized protein LOC132643831 n=1 Tax=Lycium barbarum TaxID=112863 RepID=UPI00293EAF2B|nr:uncharacterized protein LOC132643831 [Lycium barbarum]
MEGFDSMMRIAMGYSLSTAYRLTDMQQNRNQQILWRKVWKNIAPTKVKCFTWLVVRRAGLTQEVLKKKGQIIVSRSQLCGKTEETNSHLFLHCSFTSQLWSLFFSLTNTIWTTPEHTADLLGCWIRRGGSKRRKKWWRIIPLCIWWTSVEGKE